MKEDGEWRGGLFAQGEKPTSRQPVYCIDRKAQGDEGKGCVEGLPGFNPRSFPARLDCGGNPRAGGAPGRGHRAGPALLR